ncbi:MAG: HAMP domain-containing protein [Pseudomonadota bacterium]|nr:HAMP domain-containing protein [Pseudomonadota bacterium]
MRLGLRISFFVAFTAILPLLLLALAASQVARSQAERQIVDFQVEAARSLGASIARQLDDTERVLVQQVANFRLDVASDEARASFLVATYRLFPEIAIAVLLDEDGGEIAPPLFQPEGKSAELIEHDKVSIPRLAQFRAALPLPSRVPGGVIVGEPYRPEGAVAAVLPMVFTSSLGDGVALAVELSLTPVASRMSTLAAQREINLLGADGQVLLRAGPNGLVDPGRARAFLRNAEVDLRYDTAEGVAILAALASVPGHEWAVVVAEPADSVGAAMYEIQLRTWYVGGVALLIALVGGTFLTRSITGPVVKLRDASHAVGRGEFALRMPIEGRDELTELATAFNRMSASLEQNAAEIASKNHEIERFNLELQARVEQRTTQLREAQARLVQTGQLAAVGELSAGLAHELNNPLAGILGVVQILSARMADRPEAALLHAAEQEALRCKEIVANLLRFTRSGPPREPGAEDVVDLGAVVRDVLALVGGHLRQRGVAVDLSTTDAPMLMRGDASQLGRALGQLLTSLRAVAEPGTTLTIEGALPGAELELRFGLARTVADTDDWRAAGLGFWVARQVFQEHGATLEEPIGERGAKRTWLLRAPSCLLAVGGAA